MSVFALIHGSMHGSWCWRELVPRLERLGHAVVAPDLPCDRPGAGLDAYAGAVLRELDARNDVILVGHSMGGRTLPVVAARRPVARMIFLCCVPTGLGVIDVSAFESMVTDEYAAAEFEERGDGARRMLPGSAERVFFHDCSPETAHWAARQLRWQGSEPLIEPVPIERWPDAPLDVILTRDDRAVRSHWAIPEARRWLGGSSPVLLDGSHSPFLSRPDELAEVLSACARAR